MKTLAGMFQMLAGASLFAVSAFVFVPTLGNINRAYGGGPMSLGPYSLIAYVTVFVTGAGILLAMYLLVALRPWRGSLSMVVAVLVAVLIVRNDLEHPTYRGSDSPSSYWAPPEVVAIQVALTASMFVLGMLRIWGDVRERRRERSTKGG